jgi:hypothetical protein
MIVRSFQARRFRAAIVFAAALAVAAPASAGVVTYTLSGQLDGAVGATALTATPFTWTLKANNLGQTTAAGFPALQAVSADIQLGNVGDAIITQPSFVFQNANEFAFADQAVANGVGWTSPAFTSDTLGAAFAPQSADFAGAIGGLTTTLGLFSVADLANLTFSASITPTPPVLYTLTGNLSGTLNATAFSDDPFSWTLLADTTGPVSYFGLPALSGLAGAIQLAGFGGLIPTAPLEIAENPEIDGAGFVAPTGTEGVVLSAPLFASYALGDPLNGAAVDFGSSLPIQTSGGALDIAGATNLRLFAAAAGGVPETATWWLMIVGFGGVGATLRRRRTAPSSL